jgi:hypothetical protein
MHRRVSKGSSWRTSAVGQVRFGLDSEKKEAPYLMMDANRIRKGHILPLMSSEHRGTHYH